ncbi:MAG: peptide-modifying radical SAM enzyme CbpB [Desulfobacteraceae bacterium]|nr:peptide-modifying radical SAM enzyme CbpB [Desulfobacteraceae bacterium]
MAVLEPDTAFWALVDNSDLDEALVGNLVVNYQKQMAEFRDEMDRLRFGLTPSAVYFNPTERCNFNCRYCYLPERMRRDGTTMTEKKLLYALARLSVFFSETLPGGEIPQLIFHGSEPMLAKDAVFTGIKAFHEKFHFGIQTNAVLLDDDAISFLTEHGVGIGISLDGPSAEIADATRKNWKGSGAFSQVVRVMDKLKGYPAFNVITTVTSANVHALPDMVDFYHEHGVKVVMLNPVRCTLKGGHDLKPDNNVLAKIFCRALDRTFELFEKSGQKLIVANFANVLAGIVGPTGRRLMCDISPCGGGRCFFAVSATGDVFPCSEFIGFSEYKGGNLYQDDLNAVLKSAPFQDVTARKIEAIEPCGNCAIRHFCGAPCPAEVKMVSGTLSAPSPYCEFYEQQVKYAFRIIAKGREEAYLWDGWQEETEETFKII